MAGDEPPYLPVGTDVSAKYRGAFCEAKVKKVVKSVKCKVTLKDLSGSVIVTDDNVKGPLKVGVTVEIKHPESGHSVDGVIAKLTDCSMYTVIFDDADERTLRRTQLCLKGEKHFIESETLDNLPLSNPEHFGTPVMQSSKDKNKRRSLRDPEEEESELSSLESDPPPPKRPSYRGKAQELVGKVMYIEVGDKKKLTAVPVLVTLPDAHATELRTKDHLLVRSFKDSKYLSVSKRELKEFVREVALKNEDKGMKSAMEKALLYFDSGELPSSWNKEELLGSETEVDDADSDDSSDDEPSEEKDRFVAQLYKFMDDRGTPINKGPTIGSKDLNLYKLFKVVQNIGGYNRVTNTMRWRLVYSKMNLPPSNNASSQIKNAYKKYLHAFEDFYRKLGSSMGTISRPGRNRHNSNRSLFRDREKDPVILSPREKKSASKSESKSKGKDTPESGKSKPVEGKSEGATDTEVDPKKHLDTVKRELAESFKKESDTTKEDKATEKNDTREKRDLRDTKDRKGAQKDEEEKDKKEDKKDSREEVIKLATRKRVRAAAAMQGRKSPRAEDGKKEEDKDGKKEEDKDGKKEEDKGEDADSAKADERKDEQKDEKKDEKKEEKKDGTEKKDINQETSERKDTRRKTKEKETKAKIEEKDDSEESEEKAVSDIEEGNELATGTKLKVKYGRGRNHKIYEAKVVEWSTEDGSLQYLVHYAGWNNRYDEWVKPDRIVSIVDKPESAKKLIKPKPNTPTQAPKSPKDSQVTPTQSKKRGRPSSSLTPTRSASVDVKTHKSRSPAPSGSSKSRPTRSNSLEFPVLGGLQHKARRTRRSSGYTEFSDVQSHASESEDSDLYLDEPGKEDELLNFEEIGKLSRMSDTEDQAEIIRATVPCFVEIQKERGVSASSSPARKSSDHDIPKLDVKQEPVEKSEKTEDTPVPVLNKEVVQETKKAENVKGKKSAAPSLQKESPASGSKENRSCTDTPKNGTGLAKKETPKFLPTFEVVEEPITKKEVLPVEKTPLKLFELHEKQVSDTRGRMGALNESLSDTSPNESPNKVESTSDDDSFSKVPDIVNKGEAELHAERAGEVDLEKPPILVKAVSLTDVAAIQDKADTKTRGRKREGKDGGKARGRPPSIHQEPSAFQVIAGHKPEPSPVKCTEKRPHQDSQKEVVEVQKLEPPPKKEKKEESSEKVVGEKPQVVEVKGKDENEKKKVKKKLKKKISEEKEDHELDKEKEDSKKEEGSKKSKDGNKKEKSAKKEKKAKKKKNKEADSEKVKDVNASQTPADSLVKLIANVLGESGEVKMDPASPDVATSKSSSVASLLTMSSAVPSTSSSSLPSAILEVKVSGVPLQTTDSPSRAAVPVQSSPSQPIQQPQSQVQPSVSSILLENTPPTTPEYEPEEVSQPPPDNLQLSIDRAVSRSMAEAVLAAEAALSGRLPAGGESPCGGEGSTTSNESGSSGNMPSSESSLDMLSSATKRKRDADETTPSKKKKRTSKRQEKKQASKQNGSDSEEAVTALVQNMAAETMASLSSSTRVSASTSERRPRSPRTPKFNFNLEEGRDLEGEKRISFLVEKICEIRKIYMSLKSEVAGIDRRRKRHKRKERESSQASTVTEVECS